MSDAVIRWTLYFAGAWNLIGGAGKLAYFAACAALFMSGKGSPLLLAAGVID